MKTAIFQYYVGTTFPLWAEISSSMFKEYAYRHCSDYIFDRVSTFSRSNVYFENLRIVYDPLFDQYDKVLYVDVDVVPENNEENIFNEQIFDVGMVPEYTPPGLMYPPFHLQSNVEKKYRDICKKFSVPIAKPRTIQASYLMFNSGVILWSREGIKKAKNKFLDWKKWADAGRGNLFLDQPYINGQVIKHLNYTELKLKWNCYPRSRFNPASVPLQINFIHYTHKKKKLIEQLYS